MAYKDTEEIAEEIYVPGGFGIEDYLVPGVPNIDWGVSSNNTTTTRAPRVSYAGGFNYTSAQPIGRSFGGEVPVDVNNNVDQRRQRRSGLDNALLTVADLMKVSASMPNLYGVSALKPGSAYLGMTEEEANRRSKARMEEDPEGYQIDLNRAKVLSARAAETDDLMLKRKYGAEIKKLLPEETQGLDDLTASDFFNAASDKYRLEQLKGYNRLQEIALQNQGRLENSDLNNASREFIAAEKNLANAQIKELDGQIKQAIADGKNDTALALQDKRAGLQTMLHEMDNLSDLQRETMKQEGEMNRVIAQNAGALERVNAQQAGQDRRTDANNRAKIAIAMMKPVGGSGSSAGKGTAKEREANELIQYRLDNWDDYIAKQNADLGVIDRAIQILEENPSATGLRTYLGMAAGGAGIAPATERAYGELNEKTTQMVLDIVRQLNAAGATSSVFNSPAEQEKIIGDIINPRAPYSARLAAYKSFRERLARYYENERKMTAWKGSKIGYSLNTNYSSNQYEQPRVVTASEVNKNSKVIDGGMEW